MFQLNFKNQLILGILILAAGLVCAIIFRQGTFYNAAIAAYGMLFVVHPVYPESATNPRIKLYARLTGVVVILIAIITRFEF